MTPSAGCYAGLDASLRELPGAFELETVAEIYERHWSASGHEVKVVAAGVHDVDYHPSLRCRVSHDLTVERGDRTHTTFGVLEIRPNGTRLRTFDEDPDLPWLARVQDADHLDEHLRSRGIGAPDRIVRVVPVRYKIGSRCLLRLDTDAGPVYLKILASDVERIARMAAAFSEVPFLLRPLGYSADRHMLLLPAVPGNRELHRLVFDPAIPGDERLSWMRKAGAAIATLHAARLEPGASRTIADDAHELWAMASPLACAAPALLHPFNEAVRRLTSTSLGEGPPVASHGAFRTDQLMVDGHDPVIIDIDGLCRANPARDVGNLLASLRWKRIREPQHDAFIDAAIRVFLRGYESVGPLPDERWLRRYEAGSMLKLAVRRFRKLNVGEWPLVPRLLDEAHALLGESERMTTARARRQAFPAAVRRAGNRRFMTPHLQRLFGDSPLAGGPPPRVRGAQLVAHKPDSRWTFHYQFGGTLPAVVGKVYGDAVRGRRAHAIMCWLAEHDVAVPRPLGWVDELAMLAYVHVPGRMLGEQLFRTGAGVYMEQAAAWLFALHRSALPLDRTFDVRRELESLREWADVVARTYPDHAWAADHIATRLAERCGELGAVTDRPIHKDFHHEHVFLADGVQVIDLDEVRFGDPALDLAHFCAYLRLQGCRFPAMAATLERRRVEFLTAYERLAGTTGAARYPVFYAYTCLKIAKQLCTSRGLVPRPEVGEEHRQTAEILREGIMALAPGGES